MKNVERRWYWSLSLIAGGLFLPYLMAFFFEIELWGFHYPVFLSLVPKLLLTGLAVFFIFIFPLPFWKSLGFKWPGFPSFIQGWLSMVLLSLLAGVVFYAFPIHTDTYGDAPFILPDLEHHISEAEYEQAPSIFYFNLSNPKIGSRTNFGLIAFFSYYSGASIYQVFRLWGVLMGSVFILLWLAMVKTFVEVKSWRLPIGLIGLTAPFLLNYFGHIEYYAAILTSLTAFCFALMLFLKSRKTMHALFLIPLLILCIKFHVAGFLLIPAVLVSFLLLLAKSRPGILKLFTWKWFLLGLIVPGMILGSLAYLFITESYHGPRTYTPENVTAAIFLPVEALEPAPLDRYNLFSWVHLFDMFNMAFLWTASGLFLLLAFVFHFRKHIRLNEPMVLIMGLNLVVFLGAFFVLNPLLAMPQDWDLFSIPAIPLLGLILAFAIQLQHIKINHQVRRQILGPVIGFSILALAVFFVNAKQESLLNRLYAKGEWEFRTYWLGSSSFLQNSLKLETDPLDRQESLLKRLESLKPYAILNNDLEYSAILNTAGQYYQNEKKDFPQALVYYKDAYEYSPQNCENIYHLLICHFYLSQFVEAAIHAPFLVSCGFPDLKKSYRVAIHTYVEAGQYGQAAAYCRKYLSLFPGDEFIEEVDRQLRSGEDLAKVRYLFRSK